MQNWSTTVLTPLSYDTEPTILVTFDNAKYMFNVGENTNRAFYQSRRNWKRMRGIFLTQVNSLRSSGLGGMLMSFADAGAIDQLDVVGPPGLRHYLASMRMYLFRKQFDVSITECSFDQESNHPEVSYMDSNVTVYSFPISPTTSSTHDLSAAESGQSQKRKRVNASDTHNKIPKYANYARNSIPRLTPDETRQAVIQYMFPMQSDNVPQEIQAPPVSDAESLPVRDEYRRRLPRWFFQQLPSFSLPPAFEQSTTVGYVIVGPRVRGRIDGKKLNEFGVPHSQLRSKLARGETIQFEVNGPQGPETRTVRPEDCMGRSDPPVAVVILDIPSVEMIPSVIQSFDNAYRPFRSSNHEDLEKHTVRVVYHLLGPNVLEDERYVEFMKGFPTTTEHIVSSPEISPNPVTFTSYGLIQYRMSKLDSEAFPLPKFDTTSTKSLSDIRFLPTRSHILTANLHVPLRPVGPVQLDTSASDDRFHPALAQSQPLPESTAGAFEKAKETILRHPVVEEPEVTGVKILPLGTGSAVPNRYRNVSSTLIRTPTGNILLDVGEGTIGQLTRRFGRGSEESIDSILTNLKCIFISHVHADHHMGLVKLLRQRRLLATPPTHPLYVVSIRSVHLYLKEYHELEDIGLCDDPAQNGVVQIVSDALNFELDEYPMTGVGRVGGDEPWLNLQLSRKNVLNMCLNLDLELFKAIPVDHKTKAFGCFFQHKKGWSIAFSGDTMPTANLPKMASNATLLIHEATLGDEEEELAKLKAHSTVGQAIQIAREMDAKNVLLTHFSARYPKMPPSIIALPEENTAKRKEPLVTLAFDLVEMDLDKMWKMNLYLPAIEKCFEDSAEEGDEDLHVTIPGSPSG